MSQAAGGAGKTQPLPSAAAGRQACPTRECTGNRAHCGGQHRTLRLESVTLETEG